MARRRRPFLNPLASLAGDALGTIVPAAVAVERQGGCLLGATPLGEERARGRAGLRCRGHRGGSGLGTCGGDSCGHRVRGDVSFAGPDG